MSYVPLQYRGYSNIRSTTPYEPTVHVLRVLGEDVFLLARCPCSGRVGQFLGVDLLLGDLIIESPLYALLCPRGLRVVLTMPLVPKWGAGGEVLFFHGNKFSTV